MKANYNIEERNVIVEQNLSLIDKVMEQHSNVIRTVRAEREDVYQQLAERLVKAVDAYTPERGELEGYLEIRLECELFNLCHPSRLYGLPYAPVAFRKERIVSLETLRADAFHRDESLAA